MNGLRFCHRWIASVLLVPAAAGARHSRTQYDGSEIQEIQGELNSSLLGQPPCGFQRARDERVGRHGHVATRVMGFSVRAFAHGRNRGPVRRRQPGAPCRTRLDSGAQSILAHEHAATGRDGSGADDRWRRVLGRPDRSAGARSGETEQISTAAEEDRGVLPRLEHGADGAGPRQPHHVDGSVRSRLANPSTSHRASS